MGDPNAVVTGDSEKDVESTNTGRSSSEKVSFQSTGGVYLILSCDHLGLTWWVVFQLWKCCDIDQSLMHIHIEGQRFILLFLFLHYTTSKAKTFKLMR